MHEDGFGVSIDNGEIAFHAPDGRRIAEAPSTPALQVDAGADMRRNHGNLRIDASTTTSAWNGERLDLHWAVRVLRTG